MAARVLWRLVSACLIPSIHDKASGRGVGRKTFCKTVQDGPEENPRVVPAERFFGGDEQTKGVRVSEKDSMELDEKSRASR